MVSYGVYVIHVRLEDNIVYAAIGIGMMQKQQI